MRLPKQFRAIILAACSTFAFGQAVTLSSAPADNTPKTAPKPLPSGKEISKETRFQLIRLLNAEWIFVRKPFPQGDQGLVMNPNGEITPDGTRLAQAVAQRGPAARAGERAQITNVEFKDKSLMIEINGGPRKKAKWYQRIQFGNGQNMTTATAGPDQNAKGSFIEVRFKDHVPEMDLAQVKEVLSPVFDFTLKSAAQAYTESLPKIVQDAIKDKRVLVGMNKEMVQYSKGRPPQRVREKDEQGREYEEWIFGVPPQDVEFVRFVGDEVVQLKIMKVDGEKIVKTQKEVSMDEIGQAQVAQAATQTATPAPDGAAKPKAPSLRRPGETPPDDKDVAVPLPKPKPANTTEKIPDGHGK